MDDTLINKLSSLIDEKFKSFRQELKEDMIHTFNEGYDELILPRFEEIDNRFNRVEVRLDKVDERLDKVDVKLGNIEDRLDSGDKKTDIFQTSLSVVAVKLDVMDRKLDKMVGVQSDHTKQLLEHEKRLQN